MYRWLTHSSSNVGLNSRDLVNDVLHFIRFFGWWLPLSLFLRGILTVRWILTVWILKHFHANIVAAHSIFSHEIIRILLILKQTSEQLPMASSTVIFFFFFFLQILETANPTVISKWPGPPTVGGETARGKETQKDERIERGKNGPGYRSPWEGHSGCGR